MSPAGVGPGSGRKRRANSPYQATTPGFHTLVRRRQPASAIAMKACPGLRSGLNSRPSFRHWYENTLKRLLSTRANPFIRHSREGGNPRTNIPQQNVNRDTTTDVHTATPLRLSRERSPRTPIRRRNPAGRGWGNVVRGACPPLGSGWGRGRIRRANSPYQATTPAFHPLVCRLEPARAIGTKMMLRGLRCARTPRLSHSSFRPPCVIPAKGRNPEGAGMGKCSAVEDYARRGACPPLGRRRGVAESAAPTRRTKPQLRLFIPCCAGTSRDERLVRKWCHAAVDGQHKRPRMCTHPTTPPFVNPAPAFAIPAKDGIQRAGGGIVALRLVPSLAGGSFARVAPPRRPTVFIPCPAERIRHAWRQCHRPVSKILAGPT